MQIIMDTVAQAKAGKVFLVEVMVLDIYMQTILMLNILVHMELDLLGDVPMVIVRVAR